MVSKYQMVTQRLKFALGQTHLAAAVVIGQQLSRGLTNSRPIIIVYI